MGMFIEEMKGFGFFLLTAVFFICGFLFGWKLVLIILGAIIVIYLIIRYSGRHHRHRRY